MYEAKCFGRDGSLRREVAPAPTLWTPAPTPGPGWAAAAAPSDGSATATGPVSPHLCEEVRRHIAEGLHGLREQLQRTFVAAHEELIVAARKEIRQELERKFFEEANTARAEGFLEGLKKARVVTGTRCITPRCRFCCEKWTNCMCDSEEHGSTCDSS